MLCLTMKMPKNIFSLFRIFVLLTGFSIICMGAFCISTGSSLCKCRNKLPIAYSLLPLGFLLLVIGIFWSTCHEVSKQKSLFYVFQRNPRHRETHINSVDRPDFYPPCYEDSTDPGKQISPISLSLSVREAESYNIPPPLYTESSTEFIDETSLEEEQPPSYEMSVQQQPTAEHDSNTGVVSGTCHAPVPSVRC
ncbi:transmembrane protein 252 [Emydura macquarii macquarii]|uniref:transmembrane protein 252 n=1 Tax=Emydura macquarii macquarii TaxID=1129001 RepID=UPI003529E7CE